MHERDGDHLQQDGDERVMVRAYNATVSMSNVMVSVCSVLV